MNYTEDPFKINEGGGLRRDQLKEQINEQDVHLDNLHESLQQVRHQTDAIHAELLEHNNLLDRLSSRMDETEGTFEISTRRARKLYAELTDRQFSWTAGVLIFILTLLLIILLFT